MTTQTDRLRGYVGNLGVKTPVECATTGNITLSAEQTIDGITTSESRVLVKDQTTASENGVYISSTGTWERASDMDGNYDIKAGTFVAVGQGTVNAGQIFVQTTVDPTVGTSNLVFESLASYLLNATNVLGIGTTGNTNAPLWEAADALNTGVTFGNTSLIDWDGQEFVLKYNIDENGRVSIAGGSSYLAFSGSTTEIYSYSTAAPGAYPGSGSPVRFGPHVAAFSAELKTAPTAEYQISLFGHTWLQGAVSTSAGKVFTISQNSYKNAAGDFVYNATDEASQIVMRDGTVVLKCAASAAAGTTVTWVDILAASPTAVTITGDLNVTGTVTGSGLSQWTTTASGIHYGSSAVSVGIGADPTVAAMRVLDAGLLISGTSPIMGIKIENSTGSNGRLEITTRSGEVRFDGVSNNPITFCQNGTEGMRYHTDGTVGIGTSAPGSKLDVKGTLRLSGSSSGYVGLAPAAAAGSTTYTLPSADGSSGQVLSTNGSGTLSWIANAVPTRSWSDVSGSRSAATTYTNTSGRDMTVMITKPAAVAVLADLLVAGVTIAKWASGTADEDCVSWEVPIGATYRINLSLGSISTWFELS